MKLISNYKKPKIDTKKVKSILRYILKSSLKITVFNFFLLLILINYKDNLKDTYLFLKTSNFRDLTFYFKDIFSSLNNKNKLEQIELNINYRNVNKLNCQRQRKDDCGDRWAKADMIINKIKYPIKLRAKGDRDAHRVNFKKMSFKIDIRGEKRYEGMEEFSIQRPVIRNFTTEAITSKLMKNNDLLSPRHSYVRLYVNGEYFGIRHLEESFSKEFIEDSKRRNGPILGLDETNDLYESALNKYNVRYEISDLKNWEKTNIKLARDSLTIAELIQNEPELVKKYFDQKRWANYFALIDLVASYHGAIVKSVKLYLNPITGLFEPVFFDGHRISINTFDDLYLVDFMQLKDEDIKSDFIYYNKYWFRSFFGTKENPNIDFYEEYFKALELYSSENYYSKVFSKIVKDFGPVRGFIYRELHGFDRVRGNGESNIFPHLAQITHWESRIKKIREDVERAKLLDPLILVDENKINVSFNNKTSRIPQLIKFRCENVKSESNLLSFMNPLSFNLKNLGSKCDINNTFYSLDNFISSRLISSTKYGSIELSQKLNKEITEKTLIKELGKEIYSFSDSNIELNQDLLIENKILNFPEKFSVCLRNNANLIIKNSEVANNKLPYNLKFEGCGGSSGSLIIENSKFNVNNILIRNLDSPNFNLKSLYGGLNVINSNFSFDKLRIESSKSEDGVNFINSKIKGNLIESYDIKSDAIDSDYSNISLNKIKCDLVLNDCLDTSYSNVKVNNLIASNIGDKAISAGEESQIILSDVEVEKSEIGIAVKDSSTILLGNYLDEDVKIPIAAYIKKFELGSPTLKIKNFNSKNFLKSLISKDSFVFVSNKRINGKFSSNEVSGKLYGNLYGIKTIR